MPMTLREAMPAERLAGLPHEAAGYANVAGLPHEAAGYANVAGLREPELARPSTRDDRIEGP